LAKAKSAIPSSADLQSLLDLFKASSSDKANADRIGKLQVVAEDAARP
jgi:hypothetical protein